MVCSMLFSQPSNKKFKPCDPLEAHMYELVAEYVNCPEFLDIYDTDLLRLIIRATYWILKYQLEPLLAEMNYAEIRNFHPSDEILLSERKTERTELLKMVERMIGVPTSRESIHAIGQAAWCVYVHHNSYKKLQEEENRYESNLVKPRL